MTKANILKSLLSAVLFFSPAILQASECNLLPGQKRNGIYYSPTGDPSDATYFGSEQTFYPDPSNHFHVQITPTLPYHVEGTFWVRSGVADENFIAIGVAPYRPSDALAVSAYTRAHMAMEPHFVSLYRKDVPKNVCLGQPEVQAGVSRFINERQYVLFHLGRQSNDVLEDDFHFEFEGIRGTCVQTNAPVREEGEPEFGEIFGAHSGESGIRSPAGNLISQGAVEFALVLLPNPALAERDGSPTKAPVAGLSSSLHYITRSEEVCIDIPSPLPTHKTAGWFGFERSPSSQAKIARRMAENGEFNPTRTDFWLQKVEDSRMRSRITVMWR